MATCPGFLCLLGSSGWVRIITSALRRETSKPMIKTTSNKQKDYISDDGLVRVFTSTRPRRWPPHSFPVVLVELRPRSGTRVLSLPGSGVSWMPRYSEILSIILQLGLEVSAVPRDKPESRRMKFVRINARRHARKRGHETIS